MPSLKAIRRRIASVRSTQKITKAMKMVAAAKLRRAQTAILEARPYAIKLHEVLSDLAARAGGGAAHPLLARREERRVMLLVLTSDRGLCGAFNANISRRAEKFLEEQRRAGAEVSFSIVGRKGRDYLRRRRYDIRREYMNVLAELHPDRAQEIASNIVEDYGAQDLDAVYMVYNEFKSAVSQRVVVEKLLPIEPADVENPVDFIYEPGKAELLDFVLPRYVGAQIWRALLESVASEYGARMSAMEAAASNAGEMIAKLTLTYNRARQAAITKELMEIVGGAEALKAGGS
jgi:F-type H+-transporting ATPase subunit gamma